MDRRFSPGFRFSQRDAVVILVALVLALTLYEAYPLGTYTIGFVVAHFFIFCNIVRLNRLSEIIWATVFGMLGILFLYGVVAISLVYWGAIGLSAILIGVEACRPCYHGVFWKILNPNLPQWFSQCTTKAGN